jgi:adenylyltransferase/sulfurtransferase
VCSLILERMSSLAEENNELRLQVKELQQQLEMLRQKEPEPQPPVEDPLVCRRSCPPDLPLDHSLSKAQIERYSRQLLLPSFGLHAQEALCNSSVLIIGCGGLGSSAALYLAAAGIGK